jgi:integrase/recombinase XerD
MAREALATWQVYDPTGRRKYLTDAERERFLQMADGLPAPARALCYTLALTGCRISEALSLQRHQLDATARTLLLRTLKRRRLAFRTVPVPEHLATMLLGLPATEDGRFWSMHRATAWRTVKKAMGDSGVVGPMACCRGLRHAFGMRAAVRSVPPNIIQRWMGHSSSTTTAIYCDAVGVEERAFAARMWSMH